MKKIMNYAVKAAGVAIVVAVYFHFDLGKGIHDLFRTLATQLVPWTHTVFYS